ncbi:NisI/SpaI family lantibiotic immunity lipoprotein [Streptococcus uberis]|uniref:NisI/SpaI family lantibiotic immunity lipoprotein n=1 Tax=Streptococcus uberis TaxID=1349 RepID=UPI001939F7C3|nr:NisI/SpaI family lantibiotic immunity lipoprotein [Streptococcus uberis]MCK1227913.1 NisI/SpaI family lantibiotic immunity lipoprotein [Streptococcus uberis]MCK1236381.1 NisI/SpaI family lantibiotic immunity lipoprotein [Streptococcus uberis]MEE3737527.1 NisI/SpaI family lantibiotic immunity lipoprotein [Streptococcus uberis]
MRKFLFSLVVLLGIFTLVACRLVDKKTIEFHDQSFNQFRYKGNEYTIMNQIVDENDLGIMKESFIKTLVIDKKTHKVISKSNSDSISLAYSGLYNHSDGLAISINDSYYKVSLSSDVKSNNAMLSLDEFKNNLVDGNLAVDSSDCRIVKFNNRKFHISSEIVTDDKLKEFLGVIAVSKTFILNTGQEIPKSELNKIDYFGSNSDRKIEVWDYGEVYLLAEKGNIAVEINNEYRIARIE